MISSLASIFWQSLFMTLKMSMTKVLKNRNGRKEVLTSCASMKKASMIKLTLDGSPIGRKVISESLKRRQSGSAITEYCVVSLAVVVTLFVPLPLLEDSLLDTAIKALKMFQANTQLLVSLP